MSGWMLKSPGQEVSLVGKAGKTVTKAMKIRVTAINCQRL